MSKTVVVAAKPPNPMPHIFPQAVIANGQVFCSGNIAMDKFCRIIDGDIKAHTQQIIKNISTIFTAAGSSLEKIVKLNIFLADFGDFDNMNEVYSQYFQPPELPCHTCVCVKSPPFGTDIEIECTVLL